MELKDIAAKIRVFRDERDWAQFHNPKDMAIAISIEASELLEHFLWKNPEEVESRIAPLEKRWVDLARSKGVANPEALIKAYRTEARKP